MSDKEITTEEILVEAKGRGCSDIHFTSNSRPRMRLDGEIVELENFPVLSAEKVAELMYSVMGENRKKTYLKKGELDFAIQVKDGTRFRANTFQTAQGHSAAFRIIPSGIKSLVSLNAPLAIQELTKTKQGLILVVGPTGSGKSTTMASMIDHINSNENKHIITIEDPIEFVHQNKASLINQREVGSNTLSFANALKGALREDPDVILVGEMRDMETIHLALSAAETGHLVFGTLHTNSAAKSINRIIDAFPSESVQVVRSLLSNSLKAVISQRLLKRSGGGRCAAYEIMISNSSIKNLIREDKIPQISSIIELGKKSGMCTMKDYIKDLLLKGLITEDTAREATIDFE